MPPPIPHSPLAQVGAKGEVRQSASQPPRPLHGRGCHYYGTYIYNEGIYTQKEELFEGLKDNSSIDWEAVAADIISRTGRVFHTSDSSTGSTINIVTVRQQNQDRFAHVPIE
uniref:Uncharacterized protein n=1 Tax=Oryza nivara TaxID=4536 RepID=A0A0E0HIJ1_ORYNI